MTQPEELKKNEPLKWSSGSGVDVWAMFCACIARDEDICSTPLGWAAKFGHQPMVEFLLQHAAQPNLPDDPTWATPLAWATRRGHPMIVNLLKRHGAN